MISAKYKRATEIFATAYELWAFQKFECTRFKEMFSSPEDPVKSIHHIIYVNLSSSIEI